MRVVNNLQTSRMEPSVDTKDQILDDSEFSLNPKESQHTDAVLVDQIMVPNLNDPHTTRMEPNADAVLIDSDVSDFKKLVIIFI